MGRSKDTLRMQPGVWYMAPKLVYDLHEEISKDTRWIYGYLCRSASEENTSFPSYNRIQKVCKVARATVSKALKELQEHGLLKVEARYKANGARHSNKYTLVVPESNMDEMSLAMAQFMKDASQEQKEQFMQMAKQFFSSSPAPVPTAPAPSPEEYQQSTKEEVQEVKEVKEEKTDGKKEGKKAYGDFKNVRLTEQQYNEVGQRYTRAGRDNMIGELDRYMQASGKKYSDHYAALIQWLERKRKEDEIKNAAGEKPKPGEIIPPKKPGDFSHRQRDWDAIERDARESLKALYGDNLNEPPPPKIRDTT